MKPLAVIAAAIGVTFGWIAESSAQPPASSQSAELVRQTSERVNALAQGGDIAAARELAATNAESAEASLGADHPEALLAQMLYGTILTVVGDQEQAERILSRAIQLSESRLGPDHERTLAAIQSLAMLNINRGRLNEAEAQLQRASAGFSRTFGADAPRTLLALSFLASVHSRQGRLADAERALLHIIEANERTQGPDHGDTLLAIGNLAATYYFQGRYAEAEPLRVRLVSARERRFGSDNLITLEEMSNLAELYSSQRRYSEAETLLARVQANAERSLGVDHAMTLAALNSRAFIALQERNAEQAEALYSRALTASERRYGADHPQSLNALRGIASVRMQQRRFAEAEPLFRRVLASQERLFGNNHADTLGAVGDLALLFDRQNRVADSEPLYARAVGSLEQSVGPDHPNTLRQLNNLVVARLMDPARQAMALDPAQRLVSGARRRRSGEEALGAGRRGQDREENNRNVWFQLLADAIWVVRTAPDKNNDLRDAAYAALQDSVAGAAARSIARMARRRLAANELSGADALARERESLLEQVVANNDAYATTFALPGNTGEGRAALGIERVRLLGRLDEVDATLREVAPNYLALIQPSALSVAETQSLLRPDEAVLLLVPTLFGTHAVAITASRFEWARSGLASINIDAAVQRLRWDLGASVDVEPELLARWRADAIVHPNQRFDRTTAFALYQELVQPVLPALAGIRRLYIVAGGPLAGLPLSVLVTSAPEGADDDTTSLRRTRWLADDFALIHVPSIQALAQLRGANRGNRAATGSGFFGVGDPILVGRPQIASPSARNALAGPVASAVFTRAAAGSTRGLANVTALRNLPRLEGTRREIESMGTAFGDSQSAILLGDQATETAVRSANLAQARVLAFATHGLTGSELSSLAEPGLVLTPPAQASESDDGYLAASEVSALRLNADWIILSACNTATGDSSGGLSGLARAFFYAGARSLLASHWPVVDLVAPRITVRTVELERTGMSRAEAFQQAIREVRMDASNDGELNGSWAHPYYWAPFVLIGDGG